MQTIIKAVKSIEKDISEQTDSEKFNLTVISNEFYHKITFLDIEIWSSENDEREYSNVCKCDYEPLEDFLRRRIMEEIEKLKNIKL